MNPMLQQILSQATSGALQNNPMAPMIQQMLQGKNPQEQVQTLLNCAKSRGIDIDAKIFTEQDLKALGLK